MTDTPLLDWRPAPEPFEGSTYVASLDRERLGEQLLRGKECVHPQVLRQLLTYDPETGRMHWLPRPLEMFQDGKQSAAHAAARWNTRYAGKEACSLDGQGYARLTILKIAFKAHRVAWAMQTGKWPTALIDHINGDPGDNRWVNLREAARSENARNRRPDKGCASRFLGVSWHKHSGKWNARIIFRHKRRIERAKDQSPAPLS